MPHRRHLLAVAAAAVMVTAGLSACGSSGSSSSKAEASTTTTASVSSDEASSSDDEATESGENPGTETLVDGPAAADKTVTFTNGEWDPDTLTVSPGEVFTFKAGPGTSTVAVTFDGGDMTYTLSGGLTESFTLETPGTYTVSEYLSGTEMTVEVSG